MESSIRTETSPRFVREGGPELGASPVPHASLEQRDLVRWGPIAAGLVTVITTLAILSALGLAIGLSAVEPAGQGFAEISTASWIWGIATAVVAFFLGGMVAGMSAAVGGRSRGLLNGLMVGASTIVAMLVLISAGAGALLGAGARALGDVVSIGQQLNVSQEANAAIDAFARAETSAWGSFIGLTLAVVLAGLGGLVAARGRAVDEPKRR